MSSLFLKLTLRNNKTQINMLEVNSYAKKSLDLAVSEKYGHA
jgi:hypothetical protein